MELITDRTEHDVIQGTAKGTYGASDLNRVESAVRVISEAMGYGLKTKTDWNDPDLFFASEWPVQSQMERYLNNIRHIQTRFGISSVPLPPSMDRLTYVSANNIERVLRRAAELAGGITSAYRFSGEFYAGEE
jgi:hypothetical protein